MFTPYANVLGVAISALDLPDATRWVVERATRHAAGYVCVTGVHGVMEAQRDPTFLTLLNQATLNTPDGMPMSWVGWLQGQRQMERVYGPDLMLAVLEAGRTSGLRHYFYGGKPGVADQLAEKMKARFPGLCIAGTFCPPFRPLTETEWKALADEVERIQPDIFWIGLSTPKQERFAAEAVSRLNATLFIAVGAAFDFHSGLMPQAPRWMQRAGLEWLFRVWKEPRRLGGRYLRNNPAFLWAITLQLTGFRQYPLRIEVGTGH